MRKPKYIPVVEFNSKHGLGKSHLYSMINQGSIPKHVIKHIQGVANVNEDFFIRRINFRVKIWNENHLMYFFMTTAMSQSDLARLLSKATGRTMTSHNTFMFTQMFMPLDTSICDYRIRDMQWEFNRVIKSVIRKAFRLKHIPKANRDLEILILGEIV